MSTTPPEFTVVLDSTVPEVTVVLEPPLPEVNVQTAAVGLAGPPGPPGPPGLSGAGYIHTQVAPAATWTVIHGLGKKPAVTVVLASAPNESVYTDVEYPDDSTVVVTFPSAESGWVYI